MCRCSGETSARQEGSLSGGIPPGRARAGINLHEVSFCPRGYENADGLCHLAGEKSLPRAAPCLSPASPGSTSSPAQGAER